MITQVEPFEGGSNAELGGDLDSPSHGLHQLAGDRESQPSSSESPRDGTVSLHEGLKETSRSFLGHADACIDNLEANLGRIRRRGLKVIGEVRTGVLPDCGSCKETLIVTEPCSVNLAALEIMLARI